MIFNYTTYINAINNELNNKPRSVWISTFGINTGVSGRGGIYTPSETFRLFSRINAGTSGSRVMVGVPTHSTDSYLNKLTFNAEYFSKMRWRYELNIHMKCWIFFRPRKTTALVGGRNVGDSGWTDISLWVPPLEVEQLVAFYDRQWLVSKSVSQTKGLILVHKGKKVKL